MLAYFDFSGHPSDGEVISIGCWIGTANQWNSFEKKWWKRLRRENVDHFHMNKFENRYPPFQEWDNDRRLSFIQDLLAFINNADILGETHAIVLQDWKTLIEPKFNDPFERKRATYIFLMQTVIWKIAHRVTLKPNETIACVFEEDRFVEEAIGQHFTNLKTDAFLSKCLGTKTFGEKVKFAPLQAADLLAYEGMKHALNQVIEKGVRPVRKPFDILRRRGNTKAAYMDEVSFIKMLNHMTKDGSIAGITF